MNTTKRRKKIEKNTEITSIRILKFDHRRKEQQNNSASGLVVKSNLAKVGPRVRFPAGALFRHSIVASIPACHAGDRGSIPRVGELLHLFSSVQ
jgi:hypothetical protein